MNLNLKNKVALISGASHGIGQAIAKSLAREGVCLALVGRDMKALKETKAHLENFGVEVLLLSKDLSKKESAGLVVQKAIQHFKKIDFLINNVGGTDRFGSFFELEDDDWTKAYELNVMSLVRLTRALVPHLKKSSTPRIINISSLVGIQPGMFNPHYAAVKAATINISKSLANSLAKDKILVNAVVAGPVHSRLWDENVKNMAKLKNISLASAKNLLEKSEAKKIPLGRVGEPEDVSELVTFLCSDKASWITGSNFLIDGGKSRTAI